MINKGSNVIVMETLPAYFKERVPVVALTNPQCELRQSEIGVRSPLKKSPVQGMTVDEELHLRTAHRNRDFVPAVVSQSVREGLHVDNIVQLWCVVQSDFVLATAAL